MRLVVVSGVSEIAADASVHGQIRVRKSGRDRAARTGC